MHDRRTFVLGGMSFLAATTATPAFAGTDIGDLIFNYSNQARRQNRRDPFRRSRQLTAAAERYARIIAQTGQFSHTAGGTTLKQRVRASGYRGGYMAENVAYRPYNVGADELARKFVVGWLESRGHRRNLLHNRLPDMGVGLAQVGSRVYAVQVFGGR